MVLRNPQLFTMSILPEEDVTGFIVRQSFERSQGRTLIRPSTVAESTKRPGWVFPSGLGELGDELLSGLPSTEELIDNHTRFPIFEKFLSTADSKDLREHHKGYAIKGLAARVGMASGAYRGRMAMCPECVEFDIKQNGYAIWRRLSLMPGILACPEHSRLLLTFCDACEIGHRRVKTNWRPTLHCVCGGQLKVVAKLNKNEQEMAISVASMAGRILRGTVYFDVSSESVTKALRYHFGNCQRPYEMLQEALHQAIGPDGCSHLGIGLTTLKRLVGTSNSCGPIRNPIQNLAAIHAVFGGLDRFSESILVSQHKVDYRFDEFSRDKNNIDKRRNDRHREGDKYIEWFKNLPLGEQTTLKLKYRKWLLELMQAAPAILRSELRSRSGGAAAYRYLMNIDKDWFDRTLPSMDRRRSYVAQELLNMQKIELLAEHIQKRYELSLRERPTQRITKSYLISHSSCETSTNLVLESEEVMALLDACAETPAKWRKRLAGITHRKTGGI